MAAVSSWIFSAAFERKRPFVVVLLSLWTFAAAAAEIMPRPDGAAAVSITAKAFEQKPWRGEIERQLRTKLLDELEHAFPFVQWGTASAHQVSFEMAIRDDEMGVVMAYHVAIRDRQAALRAQPHLLYTTHGPKPAVGKDLHKLAAAHLDTDFANDLLLAQMFTDALSDIELADRVYPGTARLVVPLRFQDLRLDPKARLRVMLTSKLRNSDRPSDGLIELTPLHNRRTDPYAGAVEGSVDAVDFPEVVLDRKGRMPSQLKIIVKQPPAERVKVYVAEFVKRPAYDADETGKSQTPR
jgi:hypothetical protein